MINARIALFGDSIGKGIVTDRNERKITALNAVSLFEKKYSVNIDNRSRFGQTIAKSYKRKDFERYLDSLDKTEKNAVVIELGSNDCAYFWQSVANDPDGKHDSITPIEEFIDYYQKILSMLIKSGVPVFCCSLVPINAKRYFDNVIGKICDKDSVLRYFNGDYTTIYRHHEMFSNAITKICNACCVPVIDLRSPFLNTLDFNSLLCEDGIHPNERGQKLIFEKVSEFTERYLA